MHSPHLFIISNSLHRQNFKFTTSIVLQINTTIDKAGISTGKIKVIYQLKNLNRETAEEYKIDPGSTILPERSIDELSNTFPGANNSMTSTRFGNTSKYNNTFMDSVGPGSPNFPMQGSASMVFDRNMVSAAKMDKLGFSLHMVVHEIDVMDLKAVHAVAKNSPFVAAACGKWTKTTPVSLL